MEVIGEFDHWRKLRDIEGEEGWMHRSLLSSHPSAIVTGAANQPLHHSSKLDNIIAYIEPGVIVEIQECQELTCLVDADGHQGYIAKELLWGAAG